MKLTLSFILFFQILISTQVLPGEPKEQLIIGTKVAEPFVIKTPNGEWDGLAMNLWEKIAREMNVEYKIKQYDLEGLIDAVSKGEVDIGVSPMTITAEREKIFDFSHPYYITGLTIAVPAKDDSSLLTVLGRFVSPQFLGTLLLLFFILFIVGLLAWFFERKKSRRIRGKYNQRNFIRLLVGSRNYDNCWVRR